MEFEIRRLYKKEKWTIGQFWADRKYFCDTLENPVRTLNSKEDKVYGDTAIPEGYYTLRLVWSPRFKEYLPEIADVRYFSDIRIHAGNTTKDTAGCPLVGENKVKGGLINSKMWKDKLVALIREAEKRGDREHHILIK